MGKVASVGTKTRKTRQKEEREAIEADSQNCKKTASSINLSTYKYVFISIFLFFVFLGPHPWHVEVPRLGSSPLVSIISFFYSFLGLQVQHMEVYRLGIKSELQLPVYTTAQAMQDP